jgi:hypothetical protein
MARSSPWGSSANRSAMIGSLKDRRNVANLGRLWWYLGAKLVKTLAPLANCFLKLGHPLSDAAAQGRCHFLGF